MSRFAPLKMSLKSLSGEKVTKLERVQAWWYNLWRYTWGFCHMRSLMWYLRHRFWDRYDLIPTKLSKSEYHDVPELMLYGCMELVVRFVEDEKCFDTIDFYNSGTHWAEAGDTVHEVYDWWKNRPNRMKEIDVALRNWSEVTYDPDGDFLEQLSTRKDSPESKRYSEIHDFLEAKLREEETEMLKKVIEMREFLWT